MEFLSLTEPILALCVEVDREACELRYADPFLSRITECCHDA
jgi:hypothetical protein